MIRRAESHSSDCSSPPQLSQSVHVRLSLIRPTSSTPRAGQSPRAVREDKNICSGFPASFLPRPASACKEKHSSHQCPTPCVLLYCLKAEAEATLVRRPCPLGLCVTVEGDKKQDCVQHRWVKGHWGGRGNEEEVKQKKQSKSWLTPFRMRHPDTAPLPTLLPYQLVLVLSTAYLLAGHSLEHPLLPRIR